jgi:hypothetical protein
MKQLYFGAVARRYLHIRAASARPLNPSSIGLSRSSVVKMSRDLEFDPRVFALQTITPQVRPPIAQWVPQDIRRAIMSNYEEFSAMPVLQGKIGDIVFRAKIADLIRQEGIRNLGELLAAYPLNNLGNALRAALAHIALTGKVPLPLEIGDWVPAKFIGDIELYFGEIVTQPIIDGRIAEMALSPAVLKVLKDNGVRDIKDILELDKDEIFGWKMRGVNIFRELTNFLQASIEAVKTGRKSPKKLSCKIGDWVPEEILPLVEENYARVCRIPVFGDYFGNVRLGAQYINVFKRGKIDRVEDIISEDIYGRIIHLLRRIIAESEKSAQYRLIADWVPDDLRILIERNYKKVCQIPIRNGDLGGVKIGTRLAGVFQDNYVAQVGDLLCRQKAELMTWEKFGKESFDEMVRALRESLAVLVERKIRREKREARPFWPIFSQTLLEQALNILPPNRQRVLEMRMGFNDSARFYTLGEVARELKLTNERIRQIQNGATAQMIESSQEIILSMRRVIIDTAVSLFERKIVVSLRDLENSLVERRLSTEEDAKFVLPVLFFSDILFCQDFEYIDLNRGRVLPRVSERNFIWKGVLRENIGLTREADKYLEILPPFCRAGYRKRKGDQLFYSFKEYQELLGKLGIHVPLMELDLIVRLNAMALIEGEYFFAEKYCKEEITTRRLANLIEGQGNPLHFKRLVKMLGKEGEAKAWPTVHTLLQKSDLFVLVGNGIYDLAENHPELMGVPDPGYRKTSPAFGITYAILRDAQKMLVPQEIIKIMEENYPRFCLSGSAIYRILTAKNYQRFFRQENGKWGLRE